MVVRYTGNRSRVTAGSNQIASRSQAAVKLAMTPRRSCAGRLVVRLFAAWSVTPTILRDSRGGQAVDGFRSTTRLDHVNDDSAGGVQLGYRLL
jgi:hypothetical protein